jgi:hypothetical protein
VEGHRGDLEGEAHHQQPEADHRQRVGRGERGADLREVQRAGGAVDQRHAVQEQPARERAHQEVLERGLVAAQLAAVEAGQHVDRDAHQLEAEEQHQQVRRRHQQHHAGGGQQQQPVELAVLDLDLGEVFERQPAREQRAHGDQGDRVGREAIEPDARRLGQEAHGHAGLEAGDGGVGGDQQRNAGEQHQRRADVARRHGAVEQAPAPAQEHLRHQHHDGADRHRADRRDGGQVDGGRVDHGRRSTSESMPSATTSSCDFARLRSR